jgi:hypothetical protein
MTAREIVGKTDSARAWTVRLGCGHTVTVPWGAAPPFGMALIVQHQETCSEEWVDRSGETAWVSRLSAGAVFR